MLQGPKGTPYEGGLFFVELCFDQAYPHTPPRVVFRTPVYHCNVQTTGAVSLAMLQVRVLAEWCGGRGGGR